MLIKRFFLFFLPIPFILVGCDDPLPAKFSNLHPVRGIVTRNGQPVRGGGLYFAPHPPSGSSLIINASVNKDGTFVAQSEVVTGQGVIVRPGVPAGTYKIIFHPPGDGSKTGLEIKLDQVVTIEAKENEINLELTGPLPKGSGEVRDDANPPSKEELEAKELEKNKSEAKKEKEGKE